MLLLTNRSQLDEQRVAGQAPIRVLVADSTRMGSQLLGDALRRDHRFHVMASVVKGDELRNHLALETPDVVILSTNLGGEPKEGFTVTRELCASHPEIRTVILLDSSRRELVVEAFRAGARGVFCRALSLNELCQCIFCVSCGQVWANSQELCFLIDALTRFPAARFTETTNAAFLSSREQEVVRCVAEGLTNREIAVRLGITAHTVKNYLFRIFDKLKVSSRVEVALQSLRPGAPNPATPWTSGEVGVVERAAKQGSALAQFSLGQTYVRGRDIGKDDVTGCMWFLVAESTAKQLVEASRKARTHLAGTMTPEGLLEAKKRASEWFEANGAAVRGFIANPAEVDSTERKKNSSASKVEPLCVHS